MLRIVFEFDQDEAEITPELLQYYWAAANDGADNGSAAAEAQLLGLESERALAAAARAQPQVLRQLWRAEAVHWLAGLDQPAVDALLAHAGAPVDLSPLTAGLSAHARAYFEEETRTREADVTDALARWLQVLRLRRLTVADDEGPLFASDDAPRPPGRKRR
ncbi:MAG: hypothetical protein ACRYG7_20635 [Janthinobacterium lividum]